MEYNIITFHILSAQPDTEYPFRSVYAVACMVKGDVDDYAVYLAIARCDDEGRMTNEQLQVPLRHCSKLPRHIGEAIFGGTAERLELTWRD